MRSFLSSCPHHKVRTLEAGITCRIKKAEPCQVSELRKRVMKHPSKMHPASGSKVSLKHYDAPEKGQELGHTHA